MHAWCAGVADLQRQKKQPEAAAQVFKTGAGRSLFQSHYLQPAVGSSSPKSHMAGHGLKKGSPNYRSTHLQGIHYCIYLSIHVQLYGVVVCHERHI